MNAASVLTTKSLTNCEVLAVRGNKDKTRRIGKVRRFVFHPDQKRLMGFIVKRPDRALMFHRSDLFVALDSVSFQEHGLLITDEAKGTGAAAINRLELDWNRCVMWVGMPLVTQSGESLGYVGDVLFDSQTGKVQSLRIDDGLASRALLGNTDVPASLVKGFRWGIGDKLRDLDDDLAEDPEIQDESENLNRGAILLSDEALELRPEGGFAEAAARGSVTAVQKTKDAAASLKEKAKDFKEKIPEASEKAKAQTSAQMEELKPKAEAMVDELRPKAEAAAEQLKPAVNKVTSAVKEKTDEVNAAVKPAVSDVAQKTGNAVNKGAFALGKQLGKTSGMFSGFMDEYKKALGEDDPKR